jgi:MoaA/NifB/PqqE/SkfB family radical SAM enzyme
MNVAAAKKKDKYSWYDTANGLRVLAEKKGIPLIGTFEITARCNLACKMCYIRMEGSRTILEKERTAQEWIALGKEAVNAGTLFLLITGGEPLIRPDFREIYEGLNRFGFIITLFTNGTLVDEKFIQWIKKIPPNKVGITLYGASPETYQRVSGDAGAYEKALKGINLFLEAGITVQLSATITHGNIGDIEALDKIAEERKLRIDHVFDLIKPVRGACSEAENERLSAEEIRDIIDSSIYDDHWT